jgi:hypothetical protein
MGSKVRRRIVNLAVDKMQEEKHRLSFVVVPCAAAVAI